MARFDVILIDLAHDQRDAMKLEVALDSTRRGLILNLSLNICMHELSNIVLDSYLVAQWALNVLYIASVASI